MGGGFGFDCDACLVVVVWVCCLGFWLDFEGLWVLGFSLVWFCCLYYCGWVGGFVFYGYLVILLVGWG